MTPIILTKGFAIILLGSAVLIGFYLALRKAFDELSKIFYKKFFHN